MTANYQITNTVYTGKNTVIFRGYCADEQRSVIIKTLRSEFPRLEEIIQLKHEYQITKSLDIPGIVKPYSLETYNNALALILEDFGGESLLEILLSKTLDLKEFLEIAIQLTQTLASLHSKQIIHKDIKPSNIIINAETKQVKITDFAIASRLNKETQTSSNPSLIEGTIAYMSPEQTGRMNRLLDYRTDYYSLGVTFYEMLTGQLPFSSSDPMELIHCHIAKVPIPPHHLNPEISLAVSQIIIKLLAKNAESRYQTAAGITYDLEVCLKQLEKKGKISSFVVGQRDLSGQLLIPQKLYGREQELKLLLAAFERVATVATDYVADVADRLTIKSTVNSSVSSGAASVAVLPKIEMMLVSGYSGVGKTSLINEIHKPIVSQRGYFIKGKFDQFKRNIPYIAIIQAFQELIQQLLTESQDKIASWQEKILKVLGINGQVIIDVIPEVELIIGTQSPVPQLAPIESQNRFNLVFTEFIRVFAKPEHPLVLFLDDLQWADAASLKLIELLMTDPDSECMLLIAAYRDNEVSSTHPLIKSIEKIQQSRANINQIILQTLKREDVENLVIETLDGKNIFLPDKLPAQWSNAWRKGQKRSESLAELLYNKTAGNPFFLTQLLQSLYQEKLLNFNFISGEWQWNLENIQAIGITDKTVVELIASNISKLPATTQEALELAACIGNCFSLEVLAIVLEKSPTVVAADLWSALQAGLILPLSNAYKIPMLFEQETAADFNLQSVQVTYKFLHDKVQQAAYSLIPDSQKQATHLRIGQLLLITASSWEGDANIFDIVNQLNLGAELITEPAKKYELAQLNLIAGKKAKAAAAYEPAFKYLTVGLELLSQDSWQYQYDLTLAIYVEAAETAYLCTNFQQMEELTDIVMQQAITLLDKVKAYEVKIAAYIAQNQPMQAVKTGLSVLRLLGITMPENPNKMDILRELVSTKLALCGKQVEDLKNLPGMKDLTALAAMRILATTGTATYVAAPKLLALFVFQSVKLSIKYGNSSDSIYAYACYGLILCGVLGEINLGYEFGKLAINLLEITQNKQLKARTYHLFDATIRHWREPLTNSLNSLEETYQIALETGDLTFAAHAAQTYCSYAYFSGKELAGLAGEMQNYTHAVAQLKQETCLRWKQIYYQAVLNLLLTTENPWILAGEVYDEESMLPLHQEANDKTSIYILYFNKLILLYLFQEWEKALEIATQAEQYLDSAIGALSRNIFYFYDSLIRLALCDNFPNDHTFRLAKPRADSVHPQERKHLLYKVQANQKYLKKLMAHAPENYKHKYELIEAEKARVLGENSKAEELYDQAIKDAKEQGYLQEEALANELAAEFYLARGKQKIAQVYLIDAYYGYIRWGAVSKVKQLEKKHANLLVAITHRKPLDTSMSGTDTSTKIESLAALDLSTVIKASQAISEELVFDKLLNKLMHIVMENAGAQTGLLILQKAEKLLVVAKATMAEEKVIVLPFVAVEKRPDLPLSVINYVARTQKTIVLDDASQERLFTEDPYIVKKKPKSIVGLPIIYQGKLTGILYLENRLTSRAFTEQKLQILSLLCAQISISIENSNLYQYLQSNLQELEIKNRALKASETREREKANQLEIILQELQNTQMQLIQSEKMSSLGQMVAGIAHEINNPLSFITGNLSHTSDYTKDLLRLIELYQQNYPQPASEIQDLIEIIELGFLIEDLPQTLQSMQVGADRISEIVRSLRNFSRLDAMEKKPSNIHEMIDSTLMILQNRLKAQPKRPTINIIKEYGNIPIIQCYPGQLHQVFMNILANAVDAIEESAETGEITKDNLQIRIHTQVNQENYVIISIADNGPGITEDVRQKLFDPFFTTKPVGKGTGIGLSISYQIVVEKHQGQLNCISAPGEDTEFIIKLPI
jgi:predicted ATPase/signal transduction histidine kinase/tRNA A-37 threonylcarbamoyl transferase component Bud32